MCACSDADVDVASVHPVMDGRSILPLITSPGTTVDAKESDGFQLQLHDSKPPKACSPGVLRQQLNVYIMLVSCVI